MNQDALGPSSRGMEPTKLVITYGGKWVGNFYEGGETELKKVNRTLTYAELSWLVQGIANIDLTRFTIDLRTLVDTGVRLRPARPKIKDDSDVEMLLCDDGHVPEVYVSVVEKVSVEPGHVGVCTDQPIYQSFRQQLAAQFQSAGGSNNVVGSIPTTNHAVETPSVNPIIYEDPTINEVMPGRCNEDERSIPDYNPHTDYGLDDFDEDYNGDSGSREGVNDNPAHYDGMDSDPSEGGRSGSMPPVIGGPNRDACEDDAINVGGGSGTAVSQPWIIPGVSNYSFEVVRTEESSSCNRLSKGKMEGGNYWIVQKFEEEHSCTIDDLHNRNRQASAWLIGEILAPKLAVSGRSLKPKEIMVDMQVEHGLGLLYSKALRAKQLAEENVFGPPDISYQLLPAYCHQLKLVNPGTITAIKTNDGEKDGSVNLSEKTCTCREFQNDLLPCCHALAAIRFCKKKFGDFCSDFYKTSTCLESYSGVIFPQPNVVDPQPDPQPNVADPQPDPQPRRRRKCHSCGQEGHNIRTCPTRPYDNPMDPNIDVE
ncbi:hypothetical protein EZV62_026117 [Acer yangbiense]|uniref:SWIM-type domain-containing protein n=1 Tax=Acer yangbiense TaxID=1000413 RepID=A0A5C7GQG7_9ROSI|nr:hypothetical protein EZV62_026117 [Acer yangbiense]